MPLPEMEMSSETCCRHKKICKTPVQVPAGHSYRTCFGQPRRQNVIETASQEEMQSEVEAIFTEPTSHTNCCAYVAVFNHSRLVFIPCSKAAA
jgi:hypothetical protein